MARPRLEPLETRDLLAITAIEFVNDRGQPLSDYHAVRDDADVWARVTATPDLRGRVVTVHLYEDDGPFNDPDYIGPISVTMPQGSDTVTFRFNAHWTEDGFGFFGDPEYQLWASTSAFETVSSQHLVVSLTDSPDPNDTITEARRPVPGKTVESNNEAGNLGAMTTERVVAGSISHPRDVDLYKFTVGQGQWVSFDLDAAEDVAGAPLDSFVRVFDSSGKQLTANDSAATLTDTMARESFARDYEWPLDDLDENLTTSAFAHYVFRTPGTYYVAVSGHGNQAFDPRTGGGDAVGDQGRYTLTLTPLTRLTTSATVAAQFEGELRLPNPEREDWRRTMTRVTLRRVPDATGSLITPGLFTWILIHGRVDSARSWTTDGTPSTAQLLAAHRQADQVLTLDWSEGAASNDTFLFQDAGLQGTAWIPLVGQWAQSLLEQRGIGPPRVGLVGHSWGTYVSYEIASRGERAGRGEVAALVALDPAFGGTSAEALGLQYAAGQVHYSNHSRRAWAFYGGGIYGSWRLAATADNAFALDYGVIGTTPGAAHDAPRDVFRQTLLMNNVNGVRARYLYRLFHLNQLLDPRPPLARPWRFNQYRSGSTVEQFPEAVFEAVFEVTGSSADGGFRLESVDRLTFRRLADGSEVFFTG